MTIFAREPELGGELGTDSFSEEEGGGATPLLVEGHLESTSNGVFTRVEVSSEEDRESLGFTWRVRLPKDPNNLRVGEPLWDWCAVAEATAEFGTRNVKSLSSSGNLVDRAVLICVWEVGHHLEGNNLNAQFLSVLLYRVLGIIRPIEFNTLGVLSGSSVVTSNNEVRSSVILTNDSVPDCFTWTTHSHGKREKAENSHSVGVAREKRLVYSHPGEVINVARLGEPDDRVNKHIGLSGTGSADCELPVCTMHGVSVVRCINC